jgi:tellurite resistance protein TerC
MHFRPDHPLVITYKWARRIVIAVVGFTVLAVGVAMIVLPGPAIVVIPVGLGILGLEFAWARHWLQKIRERGDAVLRVVRKSPQSEQEVRDEHRR